VGCLGLVGGGEWDEESVVEFGVEDRDVDAVAGQDVAVAVG
jgi:hypothetical protein